jgi:hypothetical protein
MSFKNFAITTVLTAPVPPLSGTSLVVKTGKGSLFSSSLFRVTIWPIGETPLSTNAEICYVTNRSGDVFTIQRQQEGTIARAIQTGDQIAETITSETTREFRNVNRRIEDDNYIVSRTDDLIICNKTGDMTVSLIAATGSGKILDIKNINTGTVTIDADGTDIIDGDMAVDIYQGENLQIADYDVGKWTII